MIIKRIWDATFTKQQISIKQTLRYFTTKESDDSILSEKDSFFRKWRNIDHQIDVDECNLKYEKLCYV